MSLEHCAGKIMRSFKDFNRAWGVVRLKWHDKRAERFEEDVVYRTEQAIRRCLAAMEELNTILSDAERDCGPDE